MKIKQIASAVVFSATMLAASNSYASLLTYDFGEYIKGHQQPGITDTFATLTVDTDTWTFKLEAFDNFSLFGSGAFLGELVFDGTLQEGVKNGKDLKVENVTSKSGTVQVYSSNGAGGKSFQIGSTFGPGNAERLLAGDWVAWTFVGLEGFTDLMLHIQGIGSNSKSAWYGPGAGTPPAPIPLPGAAWLFGTALLGLGRVFHKSRKPAPLAC